MNTAQRHAVLQQFRDGIIDVPFNVRMLEGFDSPNINGVYLAMIQNPEPTSTKYIQMVGRVKRYDFRRWYRILPRRNNRLQLSIICCLCNNIFHYADALQK